MNEITSASNEVDFIQRFSSKTKEPLGLQVDLTELLGIKQFKVYREILKPGHRSSGFHFHSTKEEFVFVLRGRPSLKTDLGVRELKPLECVGFGTGPGTSHMILNESTEDSEILIVFNPSNADSVQFQEIQ